MSNALDSKKARSPRCSLWTPERYTIIENHRFSIADKTLKARTMDKRIWFLLLLLLGEQAWPADCTTCYSPMDNEMEVIGHCATSCYNGALVKSRKCHHGLRCCIPNILRRTLLIWVSAVHKTWATTIQKELERDMTLTFGKLYTVLGFYLCWLWQLILFGNIFILKSNLSLLLEYHRDLYRRKGAETYWPPKLFVLSHIFHAQTHACVKDNISDTQIMELLVYIVICDW